MIAARSSWIAWAWVVLIFVGCWLPAGRMPVEEVSPLIPHLDKMVHFGMFVVFSALARATGVLGGRPGRILMAGLLIAIATEIGQGTSYVGRDPDIWDVAADTAGVFVGLVAVAIARYFRNRGGT